MLIIYNSRLPRGIKWQNRAISARVLFAIFLLAQIVSIFAYILTADTARATSLTLASAVSETQQTTTSVSYTNTDTSIAAGSLPAGTYLVTWGASTASSTNTGSVSARLTRGATEVAAMSYESLSGTAANQGVAQSGYWLGTLSGSEALTIQFLSSNFATVYIDSKFIKAVRLDSNLTADADYFTSGSQEANTDEITNASTSGWTDVKTLTKTFDSLTTQNYLVFASMEISPDSTANDCSGRLEVDGTAVMTSTMEGENTTDQQGYAVAKLQAIGTGSKSIKLQGQSVGTATCDYRRSRVYVLRANIFDQVVESYTPNESTMASATFADKNVQSYTPKQSETVMVIGSRILGTNNITCAVATRISDGTNNYVDTHAFAPNNTTDYAIGMSAASLTVSATTTFRTQYQRVNGSCTVKAKESTMILWSMTLKPQFTQAAYRWYSNADNVQPGSAKANENTTASALITNPLRLRTQLTAASALVANSQGFKLQSATSTGGPWTDVQDAWCNDTSGVACTTSWGARRKITMNNLPSNENLADFPLLVKVNSSRIDYAKTQGSGQDIRFVDPSNPTVALPHQIEKWDEAGDSYVWVKVPQIEAASSNDYLWMYYDNASASDGQDASNVWDSNFRAVWHSNETSGTTSPDSTSNTNTLTKVSATSPNPITGQINGAQDYNGSSSFNTANDSNSLDITGAITMSAWVKADTLGGAGAYNTIAVKETTLNNANYFLQATNSRISFGWYSGGYIENLSNGALSTGTWYHIAATFEESTDIVRIYINGNLDTISAQSTTLAANVQSLYMGKSLAGEYWDGIIDEVRLSSNIRSQSWIKAEYDNQNDSMNSFGTEQTQTSSPWGFYDNATPANGATLSSTLLTGSDTVETYQESNPVPVNPNAISAGNQGEWDFSLSPTNATTGTTYYFRMAKPDGSALTTYSTYPQILTNSAPNSPSSLAQKTTGDVTISTGAWHTQNSVKFTASATDPDPTDTLQLCVEKKVIGVSFSNTEDSCGTGVAYSGSAVAPTVTISSIGDGVYHWQARVKDASGDYSPWVSYGGNAESATDFGIDVTPPVTGTVYDGLSIGSDLMFNDGTLTTLSANWTGFSDATSGLAWYDYSIGTTPGGTDIKGWGTAGDESVTSGSDNTLTLRTSQVYYVNIRALDEAGNISSGVASNGQYVLPTLSFGVSPGSVTFDNLNSTNSYADSKTTTLTTSTNAYGGYVVRAFALGLLSGAGSTIADFPGSYAATAAWGSNTGFGYTTSDDDITGFPSSGSCTGSGVAPCYAAFSQTKPGDVVANHMANVTGTPISNEQFTISYRVATPNTQKATNYAGTIIYSVTPMY